MSQKYALAHMNPTIAMVAQGYPGCALQDSGSGISYREVRIFYKHLPMEKNVLYLVRGQDAELFPGAEYASVCNAPVTGSADRITAPELTDAEVVDRALAVFSRFRQQEQTLDELVFEGCSLQQLCEAGSQMLDNPVYIHDDWFMMLAQSSQVDDFMPPEYTTTSQRGFLPKVIVDDLQYDSDYLETYAAHDVQHWHNPERHTSCLFVNLWEGAVYRGRLLVMETNHPSRPSDYRLTQVLGQRALSCLHFPGEAGNPGYRSMDDVIWDMLCQKQPDSGQTRRLLDQLGWELEDPYVCLYIAPQEDYFSSIQEHSLHSDLFRYFPNSYVLLREHRQVVVLNMRRLAIPYNMLHHTMAPLCRDHLLYTGISSPVSHIGKLHIAFSQARIALESCFRQRGDRWIRLFSGCALEHIVNNYRSELPLEEAVSPALRALQDYDKRHDTPYFETLRAYLLCERDIPKTSEMLIIHRTTLLYRLKKINALVTLNLDNTNQRMYLLLSLFIMDRGIPDDESVDSEENAQPALQ
ncbi:MAG: helix-turn-helix domain-containing protein [Candidatus Faecousia sp.]|nr:helix-turn-helix domain-containing protein [Candidatus Faecousia sp.]